jgi:membrane protein
VPYGVNKNEFMKKSEIKNFLALFITRFQDCNTMTWAASVAFYTALSLAPVLIIFLALSPLIDPNLKASFVTEVGQLTGPNGARAVEMVFENAEDRLDLMSISGLVGAVTLAISASLVFGELRSAFSQILDAHPTPPHDPSYFHYVWTFLKGRFFQMGLALGFIFILITSLIVSTGISAVVSVKDKAYGDFTYFVYAVFSFVLYIGVFSLIFRYLPECHLPWRESGEAATLTSALFIIGKELVGAYLGNSSLNSSYGAAGSVIVLLAWVYYSAMIIFVGAHVSYILQKVRHPEGKNVSPAGC